MPPIKLKDIGLRMARGATPTFKVKVKQSSGAVQSLAGWTLTFKAGPDWDTASITKTIGSGITVTDEANGVFAITMLASDTSGLTNVDTVYNFSVRGTHANYPDVLLVKGTLTIEPSFV